jgi:hypothetical protein
MNNANHLAAQIRTLQKEMTCILPPKLNKAVVRFSYVIPLSSNDIIGPSA